MKKLNFVAVSLFLVLLACYAYTFPRWADPNQNSRLDMIVAVVDDGTFKIDNYVANTVDYAKVGDHYYSDKAPGTAFLGIPFYAGFKAILNLPAVDRLTDRLANSEAFRATLREDGTGVLKQKVRFALSQVLLTFVVAAVPSALLGVLLFLLAGRMGASTGVSAAIALGYGLLTPAFAYAGAFYGHQLAAALLFGAFYLLFPRYLPNSDSKTPLPMSAGRLLLVGALLGYAVVTEYPAALIVVIVFEYAAFKLHRQKQLARMLWVIAPMAVCAAALLIYNNAVFGGPFKLGYNNSELWTREHSVGFMSLNFPHPAAAFGITFGVFRGLFVLSPLLLLAVPGFWRWARTHEFRAEWTVALLATLSMFLFNASSVMWWGGFAIGPRYVLPGLPFMALSLTYALRAHKRWLAALTAVLFAWSFVATWGLTLAEQAFPSDSLYNPLVQYALPNWIKGNIARNVGTILGLRGPLSLAPLLVLVVAIGLVTLWNNRRRTPNTVTPVEAVSPTTTIDPSASPSASSIG